MEAGDNSAPPLSASERQLQALTANIQELARQSAADRREMQELAKQNQELMALLRSRGEIPSPGQGQNGEEIPHNETGRNQNQNHNQNDEGSSANQNREPHPPPHPSQVADPARSTADARAAKLEEELKEMREQMKEMKSQVKAKAAKNLDMLVHRSESPFTKRIDEYPLPAKFKVPQLETFDGFKDPLDYLDSFRTIMRLHGVSDEIMCRTFPTNLRGSARTWFNQLETGSIDTFAQLSRAFIDNFIGGRRSVRPANYLLNIRQREGESLSYAKDPPKSMSELMYEAQKFINAEDAFQARDEFLSRKRKEPEDRRFDSSRNKSSRQDYPKAERKNISSSNRREERPSSFTPLNMSIDQVLLQIEDNPDIKWPGKLRSDPTKRSKDLYCRFHRDHGHTTEDCFALKQQIEALIRQGKLGKFVRQDKTEVRQEPRPPRQDENKDRQEDRPRDIIGEIRTIVGGLASGGASRSSRKAYARQAHNILVTQRSRKSFEDGRPRFLTRRVLVDNGSSADIIYLPAYQQMKVDKEQLKPIDIPLVGFTGDRVKPLGVVSLVIEAGTYPRQVRTSVEFLVVDCPSAYNVIIGRPTLNKLRAVTSTYHLLVRFPTEHGIGELKGDQATARECYFASLGPEATHQTMKIDEGHILVEPTEELEEIVLDDEKPSKTTSIGTKMDRTIREGHDQFPEEQSGRLCMDARRHAWNRPSNNLPQAEQKLLTAGFIREVFYPDWLANVVMVKKANGYNQIMMDESDQEKTSFITSKGLFCYRVMPFGLKNAGATYQRLMNKMFHHQIGRNMEVYVDDMLVKTKDDMKHLEDLKETFETLRQYRMKLNPSKCVFGVSSGKFLGFMVSQRGIEANPDKIKAVLEMTPPRAKPSPLYLAVSPTAVSSALIREDGGTQLPVYYTSRAFQGAEDRYPAMEKLALALVIAARKLRPYFQSHKIIVLTNHPLRKAMNKPDAAGRLIQWAVELSEFDIEYHPRQAIKAQALADFIAEFTVNEDEPSEEKPDEEWEIEIDGSSVKGAGGVGIVFKTPEGHLLKHSTRLQLKIRSDSQLIVGQVNGEYEAREDRMTKYLKLVKRSHKVTSTSKSNTRQAILEEELSPINVSNSWMTPIINYLEDETLPTDPVEARKLKVRCTRFALIQGILYKRSFSLPYLRCLDKAEADYVMREVHEGICGNHSGARSLVHKLVRAGYYWPTMQKDAVSYVRACDKCQRFGNLIHSPPETLTPMTAPWPFAQWGLDIMGPLPVGRRQLKFLVVGIDYFTKWVEAEPLATITEKNIRGFVWKAIICRFGIPRAFISDNGRQFDNSPFREFCEELGIHNHYSSPGHPQANGQQGTPTGETPFRLTYGTEAVIPVEVGLTTWRTNNYDEESNDAQLRSNLDLVDEIRDQAEARTRVYQQRMARYYDRRVKHREFKIGDLVLRKVTLATKDPTQGKLGPTWEGPYRVVKFHRRGTYHLEKLDGDALPHPWNAEHLKKYYQ
uniref:RNA-directed DNA polymerase n=1 Tax=Fagus sylvatica TaxID=28930 RepID=A0A2N9I6U4_FAGSY